MPNFRHALVDLAVTPDENLSTTSRLRALPKALKYARSRELPQRLEIILSEAAVLEEEDLLRILTYLDKAPVAVSREVLRDVLRRRVPDREEKIMGWITQPYFEEGLEKGLEKGLAKGLQEGLAAGRAQGQAKSLLHLLEKRFGSLREPLRTRVLTADEQSLDAWLDRVIDAADLKAVFDESLTSRRIDDSSPHAPPLTSD
jgi:flagellar biosynthesis/type III secretory pathway protein FliH